MNLLLIEPAPRLARLLRPLKDRVTVLSTDGSDASPLRKADRCDLILLSALLAERRMQELLALLREQAAAPIVIVDVEENEQAILPLFEAGAIGYVPRGASAADTFSILQSIRDGASPLAPHIGTAVVARMNELLVLRRQKQSENIPLEAGQDTRLTPREIEVLQLMSGGLSNQEIAAQLMIELGTVKNHVHSILKKLGATSRVQAALSYASLVAGIESPGAGVRPGDGAPARAAMTPMQN